MKLNSANLTKFTGQLVHTRMQEQETWIHSNIKREQRGPIETLSVRKRLNNSYYIQQVRTSNGVRDFRSFAGVISEILTTL